MKETIMSLCEYVAPSGQERALQEKLIESVRDIADEAFIDALGNGIVIKRGEGPHIMLVAHADEAGVMVVDIDKDGFLRLMAVGDVQATTLIGRHIAFTGGTIGIVGVESKVKLQDVGYEHVYVDIGCSSAAEAKRKIRIGTSGVVLEPVVSLGERRLAGRALDNRVGCAVVSSAFRELAGMGKTVSVVFTALHEPGARGAKTAAFRLMPDLAVIVDAVPAGDMPEANRMAVNLGGGPVIKVMDGTAIIPLPIQDHLERAAARLGLHVQHEVWPRSTTDTGAVQRARSGVRVGGVSYPARYVGGPSTLIDLTDVEQTRNLVVEAGRSFGGTMDDKLVD